MERLNIENNSLAPSITAQSLQKFNFEEPSKAFSIKRTKHKRSKDSSTCPICKKILANRKSLKRHIKTVQCISMRSFCDLCPKVFSSKIGISSHMKAFHSQKKFLCHVCDYKSSFKHFFERHKCFHDGKFECPICNTRVLKLKKHMETHKPKISCPICQKLITILSLPEHMNRIHKKIKCKDCDEFLENKKDLRRFVMSNDFI